MSIDRVPPCDVEGPDGARVTVHLRGRSDRVGDLSSAIGGDAAAMWIDGQRVWPDQALLDSPLRFGSTISLAGPAATTASTTTTACSEGCAAPPVEGVGPGLEAAVVVGAACDRWRPLAVGRHLVGRSPEAGIGIDDPSVEIHHGWLDVAPHGTVHFTQLTGRCPAEAIMTGSDQPTSRAPGAAIRVGSSVVVVRERTAAAPPGAGSVVACEHDPWRRVVRRAPPERLPEVGRAPQVPETRSLERVPPATGLVGAAIAALGAGVMAVVLGQMLFAVFALVAAVGSVATWLVGAIVALRGRRRSARVHERRLGEFEAALRTLHREVEHTFVERHPSVVDALTILHDDPGRLWRRRLHGGAPPSVVLGRGDVIWSAPLDPAARATLPPDLMAVVDDCETLVDVAVPCELEAETLIALHGDRGVATALVRSIVVQLAASYGPADVQVVVVTGDPERWRWTGWLPHAGPPIDIFDPDADDALASFVADTANGPMTVVIIDCPGELTVRTGAIRRMLAATKASGIVVVADEETVPSACHRVLEVGMTGVLRWSDGGAVDDELGIVCATARVCGITESTAAAAARAAAPYVDPETDEQAAGLAAAVQLSDVGTHGHVASILEQWRCGRVDPPLAATVGLARDGTVDIDLVRDGPHALVAGTTGAGKSEFLRTLVVGIAARVSPDHVTFVLIDFKGGSTFDACARLPHTVGLVTDLDEGLAARALASLEAEIARREHLLRSVGAEDLAAYRASVAAPLPRLVVVIDEFASLARDLPDFMTSLVGVAQRGRSLGIHLVLATQRPAGVVTDDIRANTSLRLALRLHDRADAIDVVGSEAPALFPRTVPGRSALRLGAHELVVFQAASCTGPVRSAQDRLRVVPCGGERARESDDRDLRGPGDGDHDGDGDGDLGLDADGDGDRESRVTELTALVDAISMAALEDEIDTPHRPWLEPLPDDLGEAPSGAIGVIDDPAHQRRLPLTWDPTTGNLMLVGSLGSGTTTTAVALVASVVASAPSSEVHVYVIDGRGDPRWDALVDVAHCGAVVRVNEPERLMRLVRRLAHTIDRRVDGESHFPRVVLVVDGLGPARNALVERDFESSVALFDRIHAEGPAVGVITCATSDGVSGTALAFPAAHRWVFRVDNADIARAAGVSGSQALPAVPGRLLVVGSGLEAQVARRAAFDDARGPDDGGGGPLGVGVLPRVLDAAWFSQRLAAGTSGADRNGAGAPPDGDVLLGVGLGADDLDVAHLRIPCGDHVFVGGAARTGKTVALRQLVWAWQRCHPAGQVIAIDRRDGIVSSGDVVSTAAAGRPVLLVVDDAERVDDPSGALAGLIRERHPLVTIIVAARLEAVRVAYGHWTREVARSRCGLIMTSTGEVDGELLGAVLPRRSLIPPRPGLAWMVDGGGHRLVQVAARMPT